MNLVERMQSLAGISISEGDEEFSAQARAVAKALCDELDRRKFTWKEGRHSDNARQYTLDDELEIRGYKLKYNVLSRRSGEVEISLWDVGGHREFGPSFDDPIAAVKWLTKNRTFS